MKEKAEEQVAYKYSLNKRLPFVVHLMLWFGLLLYCIYFSHLWTTIIDFLHLLNFFRFCRYSSLFGLFWLGIVPISFWCSYAIHWIYRSSSQSSLWTLFIPCIFFRMDLDGLVLSAWKLKILSASFLTQFF